MMIYMRARGIRLPMISDVVNISSMANLQTRTKSFSNTSTLISSILPNSKASTANRKALIRMKIAAAPATHPVKTTIILRRRLKKLSFFGGLSSAWDVRSAYDLSIFISFYIQMVFSIQKDTLWVYLEFKAMSGRRFIYSFGIIEQIKLCEDQ
jgi:hypothetical protein